MLSRYPGECAACGGQYARGDEVKIRWERHMGAWERVAGRYSHVKCPKVRCPDGVDPMTGEVLMVAPSDDQLSLLDITSRVVDVPTRLT